MPPRKKAEPKPKAPSTRKPRRKKVDAGSTGLSALEMGAEQPADGLALAEQIKSDGGMALGIYRDPIGGRTVVLASLPIDKVEPTPYQRDRSETHVKKLASAMERVGSFLDPIIAVRKDGKYWTPNGNHRLGASNLLGAKAITALVLPNEEMAYQILALNTEKAHNIKERSLEVIRMYRGLVGAKGDTKESAYVGYFEEPVFITLGAAYEKRPRFSAGAYSSVVKRCEKFFEEPIEASLKVREARADKLLQLDDAVVAVVEQLKKKGLVSPYLKNFVVARVNPIRFTKPGTTADFDATLDKMIESAKKFDAGSVKKEDLAKMGGAPAEAAEE